MEKGTVIKVIDWPGTFGDRFVVAGIRTVPGSKYPQQVDAWRLDNLNGAPALAQFRSFPLELCVVDEKATTQRQRHLERVAARTGGRDA